MAKFWIDYSASVLIEADTSEEAKITFFQTLSDDTRKYCEVLCIEPKCDDEE